MNKTLTKNRGQAMIEFVIVALGAVGFLLMFLPLMSKVSEARSKTLQSARYNAWERTVYYDKGIWKSSKGATKSIEALREESNARILGQSKDAIGKKYTKEIPLDPFLFFTKRKKAFGTYEEFIVDQKSGVNLPQYLGIRELNSEAPSVGLPFGGKALVALNMPELPTNGLYRAYSMVETKPLSWWKEFDETVAPYDTNVILADGWTPGFGEIMQTKMKEGYFTKLNNVTIKPFNALSDVLSVACIGIGVKCGRDLKSDRLSEASTSPQYVPTQRLEGYKE